MSGEKDILKGRIKEAAGVLTNNEKIRTDGNTNQAVGKVKQTAAKIVDAAAIAAKKTVEAAKEFAKNSGDTAERAAKKQFASKC